MKTTFLSILACSLLFFSCANDNRRAPGTSDSSEITAPVRTTPDPLPTTSSTTPAPTFKMVAPTTTAGMNPAHGQPGHRCDIAVGAPLNSAPATPQAGTAVPSFTPPAPSLSKSPGTPVTVTAPGMNPPHGQPGHDCAIAVGAPLKK